MEKVSRFVNNTKEAANINLTPYRIHNAIQQRPTIFHPQARLQPRILQDLAFAPRSASELGIPSLRSRTISGLLLQKPTFWSSLDLDKTNSFLTKSRPLHLPFQIFASEFLQIILDDELGDLI